MNDLLKWAEFLGKLETALFDVPDEGTACLHYYSDHTCAVRVTFRCEHLADIYGPDDQVCVSGGAWDELTKEELAREKHFQRMVDFLKSNPWPGHIEKDS